MPFTPFHMGPGCVVKAVLGGYFSLTVFGFAQVAMDLEPLVRLLAGQGINHGLSHTYLGATGIGAASILLGRPACHWLLGHWNAMVAGSPLMGVLRGPRTIPWPAAISGALIGTYSHVFFDSLMHRDVQPLAPFVGGNGLYGLTSGEGLHLLCLGAGVVGFLGVVARYSLLGGGKGD